MSDYLSLERRKMSLRQRSTHAKAVLSEAYRRVDRLNFNFKHLQQFEPQIDALNEHELGPAVNVIKFKNDKQYEFISQGARKLMNAVLLTVADASA